jgi:hypothetical protein
MKCVAVILSLVLLFLLPSSAWASPFVSCPESRTETSELTSSDTDPLPSPQTENAKPLSQSLEELRTLITDWGMDSDELLKRLEGLQLIVNEQESSLTELKRRLETEESFRKQEREAGEEALATSAHLLFLAEKERDFWKGSTFVFGGLTITASVGLAALLFWRK